MSIIYKLFKMLVDIFPDDPLLKLINEFKTAEWLGYLNYFIPVSFFVDVTMIWVGAIISYRVYKVIANFVIKLLK